MVQKKEIVSHVEITNNAVEFQVENIFPSYLNALRRILIAELDVYAFHYIKMQTNTTKIPEEFLAHRFGLIPIKRESENKTMNEIECTLQLKNTTQKEIPVYSHDIHCESNEISIFPNILLFFIHPGQEINVKCYARVGKGKNHNKWCPVSATRFYNLSENVFQFKSEVIENYDSKTIVKDGLDILENNLEQFVKQNNKFFT